jgi:hypothetical protein
MNNLQSSKISRYVPPAVFRQVLEYLGWGVFEEGSFNWTMAKDGVPLTIPKKGKMISRALLEGCLEEDILTPGDYFAALSAIGYRF